MLAGPPGYAAPLYPAAGIGLAAVLTWGRPAVLGVLAGAFAVNASLGWLRGQAGLALFVLPFVIALGAAAQAWLGARLVHRFVGKPLLLNEPRDIAVAGALGAGFACLTSPSVATLALWASGAVAGPALFDTWLTWWAGDALGALIAAPMALAFIGRPAAAWRPRRRSLGVPLVAAMALLAGAMWAIAERERGHSRTAFEREADRLAVSVQQRLQLPLHALQTLVAAVRASGRADAPTLRAAAVWWLDRGSALQAMGYSERVATADLAAFEAAARAEGLRGFRVHHRDEGRAWAGDGEGVVLRRIEPMAGNAEALGVNAMSVPAARAAIEATRRTGKAAATAGFRLTQSTRDETGAVLYQALLQDLVPGAGAPAEGFRGVLFVSLRTEALLAGLSVSPEPGQAWCLVDPDPRAARPRLAGSEACSRESAGRVRTRRPVQLADRPLELRLLQAADPAASGPSVHWLLTVAGFAGAAMLGAWLLMVTGQALRTQRAVDAATADLKREVAERRAAEHERAGSEARLRSILDNAPLGIAFLDPHGKLLQGNPHLFSMLGRTPEHLLAHTVASLTVPEDLPALQRDHQELLSGQCEVIRRQFRLQRGGGEALTVRMACTALRSPETGRVLHMVAVLEDLSEHLQLEQAERARQRAEASSRAKSEFVSRMSHELRTPLNAMLGFAQLLGLDRRPALPEHQRNWVQQIQRAGWHLLELVNDTLDLARIESGAVQLHLQPVDLAELVAASADLVSAAAAARGVELRVELALDLPPVAADATRLKQVVTNLLSNAVKYNRDRGCVTVRALPPRPSAAARAGSAAGPHDAQTLTLEVVDTGLGMTPAQLQQLFEPYNRLGREGSGVEGTGIGLVIARRLTEMMGGSLQAQSRAGSGSTFSLNLPLAAAGPAPAADQPAPTMPAPYRQRCVLYIEDNETNVEVMRGVLLQRPQVHLEVAALGLDGLAAARRVRPDLILLDMQLPDITGPELLRHLMDDDETATIPVIVVSADATPARIEQALTLGAAHYVTKPLALAPFLQVLDEVLNAMDTRFG
ncbi:MAG: CHASE domain-containing protein [Burkholderiales bacterium]|nr:CHASE domain-containing protein [Burkholderiales bacterium]